MAMEGEWIAVPLLCLYTICHLSLSLIQSSHMPYYVKVPHSFAAEFQRKAVTRAVKESKHLQIVLQTQDADRIKFIKGVERPMLAT